MTGTVLPSIEDGWLQVLGTLTRTVTSLEEREVSTIKQGSVSPVLDL